MTFLEKISVIGSFSSAAAIAVSYTLFKIQMMKEKEKEEENNAKYIHAVRSVVGKEAFLVMGQINFFYRISSKLKSATDVKMVIGQDRLWKQMYIYYSEDKTQVDHILIPTPSSGLDHHFLSEAGKISKELIPIVNNLNAAIWAINQNIDIVVLDASLGKIEPLKEMVRLMVNGSENSGNDLVRMLEPVINEFNKEMSAYSGFESLKKENETYYDHRPYTI